MTDYSAQLRAIALKATVNILNREKGDYCYTMEDLIDTYKKLYEAITLSV